jgi:protein-export membrane protein SecD
MKHRPLGFILTILVVFALACAVFAYQPLWRTLSGALPWKLGLDLAGGSFLTYEIDLSQIPATDRDSIVNGLRDVIERRVNLFGVSEPRVYTESAGGTSRLVVELAGIKDVNQAIKQIGMTPFLDFREVAQVDQNGTTTTQFIPTDLNGRYVKSAQVTFDTVTGKPLVAIQFSDDGAKIFEDLTAKNIGRPIAIFLDNNLIEMPTVQDKISGGKAQITGSFTLETARQLVERFNAGALPAPINLVNQQTIDSDFGADSLVRALVAGLIGTLAVMLFMVFYYRTLGLFAAAALLMYIAFSLGMFKLFGVTMTLSGIAGFILSIGMAVDANVLVFERTKEELRKGLLKKAALEEGFRRAWTSIRDSNISTLITAAVLYTFTSSFVRGFALTLFLGVLVSMFSAITVTRTFLRVFMGKETKAAGNGKQVTGA